MNDWRPISMRDGKDAKFIVYFKTMTAPIFAYAELVCQVMNIDNYKCCFVFPNEFVLDGSYIEKMRDWYDAKTAEKPAQKPKCPYCGGEL